MEKVDIKYFIFSKNFYGTIIFASMNMISGLIDNDYLWHFLGYPIWWEVAPTIINTFIESNDFQGATVIPFATSGGSTIENSIHALMQKYPEIKWKEGKLLNNVSDDDLAEWIKSIL